MAMHSSRLTQDQNFSVHLDGVKANGSTVQKNKGGLRGRKALNDISNLKNVIPIGEDLGVSKIFFGGKGKPQISGKKAQVSGRKAFGQQQGLKKSGLEKISMAVAEDEHEDENLPSIEFHNHEECVKSQSQMAAMDLHYFLETIGFDEDVSCRSCDTSPRKSMDEDPIMLFGMEEISMPTIDETPSRQYGRQSSPICLSPDSPYMMNWDHSPPNFILAELP